MILRQNRPDTNVGAVGNQLAIRNESVFYDFDFYITTAPMVTKAAIPNRYGIA